MMPFADSTALAAFSIDLHPLLLLLIGGHLIGDFGLQTAWMVENKRRGGVLLTHAFVVVLAHLAALVPFLNWPAVGACLLIGATHAVVDLTKVRWSQKRPGSLSLFLADQAVHLGILVGVFAVLGDSMQAGAPSMDSAALVRWTVGVTLVGAFALNWNGGGAIVSGVLTSISPNLESEEDSGDGVKGSGRLIGALERTITLILILLGQWAAIVLLVAAKSIARFEELKKRRFAEYYLIGTLASLLVAIVVGLALAGVLGGIGDRLS